MSFSSTQRFPIDWACLFQNDKLASQGLQQIVEAKALRLRFEPSSAILADLWSLYWSYRMGIRQQGHTTLYFYYPSFYDELSGNTPLLRWPCQLIPPKVNETSWEIHIAGNQQAEINPQWLRTAHLAFPHEWDTLLAEAAQPQARTQTLQHLANSISQETSWTVSNPNPGLIKADTLTNFAEDLKSGGLVWLATLAVDNEIWEKHPTKDWREWSSSPKVDYTYPYLLPLTPTDVKHWQLLGQHGRVALAHQASLYPIAQFLPQLLFPHLVAGESVLIVSRDQNTLDQVTHLLAGTGWESLVSRWHNEQLDWPILKANIQTHLKNHSGTLNPSEQSWQVTFGRYRREAQRLQDFLASSRCLVFGEASWQDVLGLYLRASRREGKALLATHLQANLYTFTPSEYNGIQQAIQQTQPLYNALDSLHHPLADLNAAIFIHQEEEKAADFIQRTCSRLLDLAQPLHQRYIRRQSEYADQLLTQLENTYLVLRQHWTALNAQLIDLTHHYGNEILTVRQGTLRFKATFSKHWQAATRERQTLISAYQALYQEHRNTTPFAVEWLPDNWIERPVELPTFLETYEQQLTTWQLKLPAMTQEELLRLNYKTADPQLKASTYIEPLETALEECIDEVNALGLYQLPLQSKHLTLLRQQRYLEEIIERLERTRLGIEPFSAFYAWQRNWFSLPEIARKSIQAILRTRPADWSAAFASWYFNECLAQTHTPALAFHFNDNEDGVNGRQQLWSQTQKQIIADWQARKTAAAKTLQVAARQENLSLTTLHEGLGKTLSRFAPITLATPEIARSLKSYFSNLIIVEGQRLQTQELVAILAPKGQSVTLLHDGDVATTHSWQADWQQANWPMLDTHLAAQNASTAFSLPPTTLTHIPGLFQAATAHNEEEALAVLDWLNTLTVDRSQPIARVGIVCFTEGQRNRILQLLYEVKKTYQAAAQHIQQLERNGLQVIHLTDLSNYRFTHLAISLTYGPEDISGTLSPILTSDSPGLSEVALLTLLKCWARAKEAYWFCSCPETSWSTDTDLTLQISSVLLRDFLATANSAIEDFPLANYLPSLAMTRTDKAGNFGPLAKELIFRIGDHFPHWEWTYHRSLGPAHPLLEAHTLSGHRLLFLPDGLISQLEYSSFQWEWTQRQHLQIAGFTLIEVPLLALWKSPTTAFHKLIRQLRSLESESESESVK